MSSHPSSNPHPYVAFEGSAEWYAIDRALKQLSNNRDLVETTAHEYIVGYLCKALAEPTAQSVGPSPQTRREALRVLREAVRVANIDRRDLVEELIQERRQEALND